MGTEFEIIAGCLQGVQMLMKLLRLIIKDANLRERQRGVVVALEHLRSLHLGLTISITSSPSVLLIALYLLRLPQH